MALRIGLRFRAVVTTPFALVSAFAQPEVGHPNLRSVSVECHVLDVRECFQERLQMLVVA